MRLRDSLAVLHARLTAKKSELLALTSRNNTVCLHHILFEIYFYYTLFWIIFKSFLLFRQRSTSSPPPPDLTNSTQELDLKLMLRLAAVPHSICEEILNKNIKTSFLLFYFILYVFIFTPCQQQVGSGSPPFSCIAVEGGPAALWTHRTSGAQQRFMRTNN